MEPSIKLYPKSLRLELGFETTGKIKVFFLCQIPSIHEWHAYDEAETSKVLLPYAHFRMTFHFVGSLTHIRTDPKQIPTDVVRTFTTQY
jgi:hypothetical protein